MFIIKYVLFKVDKYYFQFIQLLIIEDWFNIYNINLKNEKKYINIVIKYETVSLIKSIFKKYLFYCVFYNLIIY